MVLWRRGIRSKLPIAIAASSLGVTFGLLGVWLTQSYVVRIAATILVAVSWLGPVLYAVKYRGSLDANRSVFKSDLHEEDLREAARGIVTAVNDSRLKASRHEYHQERTLARIENSVRRLSVLSSSGNATASSSFADVLFVTSNGAGLGHISRLLAVADKLPAGRKFELLTLSRAYKQVASQSFTVHYFPSSEVAGQEPQRWNRAFRDYFRLLLSRTRPSVVVFDGTWVYTGLTDVCRALDIPLVWMQRGTWKAEVDEVSTQRHAVASVAEHLIIPGDYAEVETVDPGPDIEPHYVAPIVRTSRDDLLPRADACAALGLTPDNRYVLLNLGGGSLGDPGSIAHAAVAHIAEVSPELTVVQVVSPLADSPAGPSNVIRVAVYPVMPYAHAFEYMIAAAGYNSAQEAACLGLPSILVPNAATKTDDQVRRARLLGEKGLCLVGEDEDGLRRAIGRMADEECRGSLKMRSRQLSAARGDVEAAKVLDEVIEHANWTSRAETISVKGHIDG